MTLKKIVASYKKTKPIDFASVERSYEDYERRLVDTHNENYRALKDPKNRDAVNKLCKDFDEAMYELSTIKNDKIKNLGCL